MKTIHVPARFLIKRIFLAVVLCTQLKPAFSANEIFNVRAPLTSTTSAPHFFVYDDKYPTMLLNMSWPQDFTNYKIINRVKIGVNQASPNLQSATPFSIQVSFVVNYYNYNQLLNTFTLNTISPAPINVEWSATSPYLDLNVFQFEGGNLMDIKVTGITTSGPTTFDFFIEGEVEVERYYAPDYLLPTSLPFPFHLNNQYVASSDEQEIRWSYVYGAEEYELEWTYINDYDVNGGNISDHALDFTPREIFKYNSTRITTTNNYYRIPRVYERGYIIYRLRAVGRQKTGNTTAACASPAISSITQLSPTSASVAFSCANCPGIYILEWGLPGFTPGIDGTPGIGGTVEIGGTTPIVITGLPVGTAIDLYIRQKCSTVYSLNSGKVAYNTSSQYIVFPNSDFNENFFSQWSDELITVPADVYEYLHASNPHAFDINAHEPDLDWQKSVTFAEEGKNKIAISYFDGSLRNRQTVSKSNTDNNSIVGETIYDHQGRGAIQVLPVPTTDPSIHFYPNFNQNNDGIPTAYDREDFDFDSGNCDPLAEIMPAASGSSNYYSPANSNQEAQQKYVPDAKEYPFSQVRFTPDNTGRISSQGGVGIFHQLGSGHETQYIYTKPWQEELDALFGSEAGNALHYKKNIVMDPNRQISVSYLDPQGRVVATSLAGNPPGNVDPIPSGQVNMDIDLLDKVLPTDNSGSQNILSQDGRSMVVNTQVAPTTEGIVSFDYDMQGQEYTNICDLESRCYDCVFDLTISLKDECGEEHFPELPQAPGTSGPGRTITIGPPGNDCDPVGTNPNYTQTGLETTLGNSSTTGPIGPPHSYTMSKILTVNQEVLDQYTEQYLTDVTNPCILHLEDFIEEEMENIDTTDCNQTCDECLTDLGPYTLYSGTGCDPCYTQTHYDSLVAECNEMCDDQLLDCEGGFAMMLADVSPMGQYGGIMLPPADPDNGTPNNFSINNPHQIDVCQFPLSVYNAGITACATHNLLPVKNLGGWREPDWKHPLIVEPGQTITGAEYRDENGNPALVELELITDDPIPCNRVFNPPVVDACAAAVAVAPPDGVYRTVPNNLVNVSDFLKNFQPSWAKSLVYYHPEWCYYEFCTGINASNDFDSDWLSANTLSEASSQFSSFLDPTLYNVTDDPFFALTSVYSTAMPANNPLWMGAFMNNYTRDPDNIAAPWLNIWQVAYITANCPDPDPACACNPLPGVTITTDAEWTIFKNLYMGLKDKIRHYSATKYAIKNGCYNGCIGDDHFNPLDDGFYQTYYPTSFYFTDWTTWLWNWWSGWPYVYNYWRSQYFNPVQPCNWLMNRFYKEKVKRFPGINDMMDENNLNLNSDAITCFNLSSPPEPDDYNNPVQCPEQDQEIVEAMQEESDWALYQQCNQCPIAFDLQHFLNAVADKDDLQDGHDITISCAAPGDIPLQYLEYVPDLEMAMFGTAEGDVSWTNDVTAVTGGSEMMLIFTNTTISAPCTLQLFFPTTTYHDLYDLTPLGTYDWIDIEMICCLDANAGTHFGPSSPYTFTIMATVTNPQTGLKEEIKLDGISCVDVEGCTFPVRCHVNETGIDVMNLFNSLLIDPQPAPFPNNPSGDFTSMTGVDLSVVPYQAFLTSNIFNGLISNLGGYIGAPWTWQKTSIGNTNPMTAIIYNPPNTTNFCEFSFTMDAADALTYSFDEIIYLSNLRPDKNGTDPSHDFIITAYVLDLNGPSPHAPKFIILHGHSACFDIGECADNLPSAMYNSQPPNGGPVTGGNGGGGGPTPILPHGPFPTPTLPLIEGQLVMTFEGDIANFPNDQVVKVIDVRDPAGSGANFGQNWIAPINNPISDWSAQSLGSVFGVTMDDDSPPNIYVAATGVYQIDNLPTGCTACTGGEIYKLDGSTGAKSLFVQYPSAGPQRLPNTGASLGNICFDKDRNQFFVSNMMNGKIYCLDINGVPVDSLDPFGSFPGYPVTVQDYYEPIDELVWGLNVNQEKLYFNRWRDPAQGYSSSIYSIPIVQNGFSGTESFELSTGGHQPISDIAFNGDCQMLLAERTMQNNPDWTNAHDGKVYKADNNGGSWTLSSNNYFTGQVFSGTNSAGGIDASIEGQMWVSGDGLLWPPPGNFYCYGVTQIPVSGNSNVNVNSNYYLNTNYYVDGDHTSGYAKYRMGCLEIFGEPYITNCCTVDLMETTNGNGDFELGNTGFTSPDFLYAGATTCLQSSPPEYTITTDAALVSACVPPRVGLDHTNPGTGKFLLVVTNGGGSISTLEAWRKSSSVPVQPNIDYTFSCWYMATDDGDHNTDDNHIFFSINGVQVLGSYTLVPFTPVDIGVWKNLSVTWNSGTSTSANLSISIDFIWRTFGIAIDDISFTGPCSGGPSVLCDPIPFPSVTIDDPCVTQLVNLAFSNAQTRYDEYITQVKKDFQDAYIKECMDVYEDFQMHYEDREHHYTLYYYDQGGNLIRTIPPEGVEKITAPADLAQVRIDRATNGRNIFTEHALPTTYKYNSLNQLVYQSVPDNENMNIWNVSNSSSGIPTGYNVYQTQFSNANNGYCITEGPGGIGHVFVTTDGGLTWTEITSVGLADINDVGFEPSSGEAYAVMSDGKALRYNGTIWNVLIVGTNNPLIEIAVVGDDEFFAFESTGKTWYTNDAGATFSVVSSPSLIGTLTGVSFNGTDGYATTSWNSEGRIYFLSYSPGILTWALSNNISTHDLNSVQFISALNGFAVGKDGTLVICNNGTWREAVTTFVGASQAQELRKVHFKNLNDGWAIDVNNYLYEVHINANNEATFTRILNTYTFTDFSFYQLDAGFVISATPQIYVYEWTTGGGYIPVQQNITGLPASVSSIEFADIDNGFVAAPGSGTVSKLTRLAGLWTVAPLAGAPMGGSGNITQMHFWINGTSFYGCAIRNAETYNYDGTQWAVSTGGTGTGAKEFSFYGPQNGFLLKTTNEIFNTTTTGQTWNSLTASLTTGTLNSISFPNGVNGAVVGNIGNNGSIITIDDANAAVTFADQTNNIIPPPLNDVSALSLTEAYAVGKGGTILQYDIADSRWENLISNTNDELSSVAMDASSAASAVAKSGKTFDIANITVSPGTSFPGESFTDISSRNGDFVATANNTSNAGVIYHSNDGLSYSPGNFTSSPPSNSFNAGGMDNSFGNGFAVGSSGKIYQTANGAQDWAASNSVTPPVFNATCIADASAGIAYAVGNAGTVYKSTDGGQSWNPQPVVPPIPTINLQSISFYDATNGYAVGTGGTIIKIEISGITVVSPGISSTNNLNDVICLSSDNIWIVGDFCYVYHFNGSIWISQQLSFTAPGAPLNPNLNAVYFVDQTFGYAVGDAGSTFKFTAGIWNDKFDASFTGSPKDWVSSSYSPNGTSNLNDVYFYDYLSGYTVGDNNVIMKSIDGGEVWDDKSFWQTGQTLYSATFVDDAHAFIGSNNSDNVQALTDYSDRFASRFWYDKLGRLVASQNTKQFNKVPPAYSYTRYDALGRIAEVGELASNTEPTTALINDPAYPDNWNTSRTEVTRTFYDYPLCYNVNGVSPLCSDIESQFPGGQQNLRGRVAATAYYDIYTNLVQAYWLNYQHATHYSYDIHGNVNLLVQDNQELRNPFPAQEFKKVFYTYDLVSGKVNQVDYQPGEKDEMHHRYEYDADNRITNVITSKDGVIWDNDAKYFYYLHGPLARTEIGNMKVQATDYAYTIQGWIKGMNSNTLVPDRDQGKDAVDDPSGPNTGTYITNQPDIHKWVGLDVFGYTLGYFNKKNNDPNSFIDNNYIDYYAISQPGENQNFEANLLAAPNTNSLLRLNTNDMYNGNISHTVVALASLTGNPLAYGYQYDQLNRLKSAVSYQNLVSTDPNNHWSSTSNAADGSYNMSLDYDENGNIDTLRRQAQPGAVPDMDDLVYKYDYSGLNGKLKSNKLYHVSDIVALTPNYTVDIDDQGAFNSDPLLINQVNNYRYDELGNLKHDEQEKIERIEWTVYGKIKKIIRISGSTKEDLEFKYDASGNRVEKITKPDGTSVENGGADLPDEWTTTYYVRDASGNIMAVYNSSTDGDILTDDPVRFSLGEQLIYGSSRLGLINRYLTMASVYIPPVTIYDFNRKLGDKQYELTNHLGNVYTTFTDNRLPVSSGPPVIDYYTADISGAQDYYPFGMLMPGRTFVTSTGYRFGMNGQENDDEVTGNKGSHTSAEHWEYDSRLGKRWNIDPVVKPWESSYSCFSNNSVWLIDPKGNDTLTFKGSNGNNIQFIHDFLPKMSFEIGMEFSENQSFNLNGSKLPDAIGYNVEISANGSLGNASGSAKGGLSFTIFTEGQYAYQPFKYAYGGLQGGGSVGTPIDGDITANVSPFVAWHSGNDSKIDPYSWERGFKSISGSVSFKAEIGGTIGGTYFSSMPFDAQNGWQGASLDVGLSAGAGFTGTIQGGVSYYKLLERNVTKTAEMGLIRYSLKWADMVTVGSIPGTFMSDVIKDVEQGWDATIKSWKDWLTDW